SLYSPTRKRRLNIHRPGRIFPGRLPLHRGRAAGVRKGPRELLSGQGLGVVQPRGFGPPPLGDGPDGQVLLDALDRRGVARGGALLLQAGRRGHDRLRPGAVEETGLADGIGRAVRQRAGRPSGPALETARDVADDAVEEGAKGGHAAGPRDLHDDALAETLDE